MLLARRFRNLELLAKSFSSSAAASPPFDVKEVKLQLGEYHLAGKFWGDTSISPVLCIHGAQESAGSFDRLIPHLPKNRSYLAYDLIGHGFSTTVPNGMQFDLINYIHNINDIRKYYKVDKISLIGHSGGANCALTYGTLFPENVKSIIALDPLKTPPLQPMKNSKELLTFFEKFYKMEQRNLFRYKKTFSMEELSMKYAMETKGSINQESAPYILNRCVQKCEKDGKYFFNHDNRFTLETVTGVFVLSTPTEEVARRINFPVSIFEYVKQPFLGWKKYHDGILDVLKENEKFELHTFDEMHHVHLTHPEKIAGKINEFIEKYDI